MRKLSERAFAIMAVCEETKRYFGITVDEDGWDQYRFVWAFKIDRDKGKKEGYDSKTVTGSVTLDDEYPGCPYCAISASVARLYVTTASRESPVQIVDSPVRLRGSRRLI